MIASPDPHGDLSRACDRGVEYLIARQRAGGGWEDYHAMPVGPSTQWVSAVVSVVLFGVGGDDARAAARRGALWLMSCARNGWGFNAATPPDGDSTAWALIALRAAGVDPPDRAIDFLRSLHRPDGGFATYRRDDAWGRSHADVTPLAVLALPERLRAEIAGAAIRFAVRTADAYGTWPSYWWRGRHYATYWNRVLLAALDHAAPPLQVAPADPSRAVETAFDLAWALALSAFDGDPPHVVHALARILAARQLADGSWAGGRDLRVTAPQCYRPWVLPLGTTYEDDERLMTTASAVRALGFVLGRRGHAPAGCGSDQVGSTLTLEWRLP